MLNKYIFANFMFDGKLHMVNLDDGCRLLLEHYHLLAWTNPARNQIGFFSFRDILGKL